MHYLFVNRNIDKFDRSISMKKHTNQVRRNIWRKKNINVFFFFFLRKMDGKGILHVIYS